jgi:hypothetical protein
MNRWRVGEDMRSKETDGCPLTSLSSAVIVGNAPDRHALIWEVIDFYIILSCLSSTLQVEHCRGQ